MRKVLSSWCWEDVERQAGVPADGMGPSPSESLRPDDDTSRLLTKIKVQQKLKLNYTYP